ncbi:UNVERIFIED_CONTAM: hypothetical protein FKN15_002370 [Acipenser sinensis]
MSASASGINSSTLLLYQEMYRFEKRLQTFTDWPFTEGCQCTPEKMALAGFVHCPSENEPDVARCFFCLKELEGWEPDDDPWHEHSKRSLNCGFLSLKQDFEELSLVDFFTLEQERLCIYIRKAGDQQILRFQEQVDSTRTILVNHFSAVDPHRPELRGWGSQS